MKHTNHKEWTPNENITTNRKVSRALKLFYKKMMKQATRQFIYVWNNYLDDDMKEMFYNKYSQNYYYVKIVDIFKSNDVINILNIFLFYDIIDEKLAKLIKRKWIIEKLL